MRNYPMSREELRRHCEESCKRLSHNPTSDMYREHRRVLDLLNQTEWIPVSKGLPQEKGWYQCTVVVNDLPRTMDLFYKNSKWIDNRRVDMFNTYDIYGYGCTEEKHKLSHQELISEFDWTEYVTAWMPRPLPYTAESKERYNTWRCL